MSDIDTLLKSIIDLLDVLSYLYISSTCAIFLHLHGEFESAVQEALRPLCGTKKKVPRWLTVEFIAYARLYLAIPTILFLAWGYRIVPSILVLVVHLADSFKEIVGKYWSKMSREIGVSAEKRTDQSGEIYPTFFKSGVAESSDFEVVTTDSAKRMLSLRMKKYHQEYIVLFDDFCDKAYVLSCWIYLMSTIHGSRYQTSQYISFLCLIMAEVALGYLRCQKASTGVMVYSPQLKNGTRPQAEISTEMLMKLLRRAEFLGTSFFICSYFRYLGSALLLLACPLAYESFRRESIPRVIYVVICPPHIFDHKVIDFWNQAKSLGSKLLVGVIGENQTNMVQNACSITSVDEVIAEAPAKADLIFLERQGIDFVVLSSGQSSLVTDEVKAAGVCLFLDNDQIVQRH